jgi:hypothetical protein
MIPTAINNASIPAGWIDAKIIGAPSKYIPTMSKTNNI